MNKKLILILICLSAFGTVLFAQKDFTESARQKATAGQFSSDSDNVNANDIFDIERTFFSAGYQPALTLGNDNSFGNMTAFWAMPINDTMTIGIAGEYEMLADRTETTTIGGSASGLPIPNGVDTSITLNEKSDFNIRPVFKFGNFAFSYRIARSMGYNSVEQKTTLIPSGKDVFTNKTSDSGTDWEHEIGFAWNSDMFKIYVPIGALINMNSINEAENNSTSDPTEIVDTLNKADNTVASLYINPEISFPVEIGPITQFKTGIDFKMGIFAPYSIDNLTTYSGTFSEGTPPPPNTVIEEKFVTKTEGQLGIDVETFLQTTMEWATWEDKIDFIFEPIIGIKYSHLNLGDKTTTINMTYADPTENTEVISNPTESDYSDTVTPYLKANIGSTIKFTEWFELRAGLSYKLNWENTTTTISYALQEGGKLSKYGYNFTSEFEIYSGLGFIIGEDFFIDVYIAAGNFIDTDDDFQNVDGYVAGPNADDIRFNLFDIRNYGVQLSYRF